MTVYQPRSSLVTLSFRPTQHLKTRDGYTALRETSRQQRGVACAQCIPYLAIDRGENDWQREPEVSEPPSALRACLVTKMAETLHDSATKQVSDILELAITDWRVLDHIFGKREKADSRVATVQRCSTCKFHVILPLQQPDPLWIQPAS